MEHSEDPEGHHVAENCLLSDRGSAHFLGKEEGRDRNPEEAQ